MVDRPTLDRLLANLERYVAVLRDIASVPRETLLSDRDKIGSAKYHFVVAIESCIDIANHIIASENYRFPNDNADSFVVLIEHGILMPDLRP